MADINTRALLDRIREHFSDSGVSLEDYQQGGSHMTYIATLSSHRRVFIRVQRSFFASLGITAGIVSDYKMASEVATLRFLRAHTDIPVPSILLHDVDKDNVVGSQWMIVEYIDGVNLSSAWYEMSYEQRERVCIAMADIWSKSIGLSFEAIGSLYESKSGGFHVGPMTCLTSKNRSAVAAPAFEKCGPFSSALDWLQAVARRDLDYVYSRKAEPSVPVWIQSVMQSLADSVELRQCSRLPASRLGLEHIDFSPHNVLVDSVDPTQIVSVVDWEAARVVPLWAMSFSFRWPDENMPEQDHLNTLMRDHIISRVPEWRSATGTECGMLRKLARRAETSNWDPAILSSK